MNELTQPSAEVRPAHQRLIDEFLELDRNCTSLIERFTNGNVIYDCIPSDGAPDYKTLFEKMVAKYMEMQEIAKELIEKRNAKLQEAAAAMRAVVMASEKTMRGPEGKPSYEKYGPFEVASKTIRTLDADLLMEHVQKAGLWTRLLELSYIDKNSGKSLPAMQQEWMVRYEPVKNWLRENNLEDVFQAAYEEEESTPAVTGPKPIAWIGDVDKTKKGKK